MIAREPHILVVTDIGEEWPRYDLECPGVSDWCREWRRCNPCTKRAAEDVGFDDELIYEEGAHGVEHRRIQGDWMVPTDRCLAKNHDGLSDSAGDVTEEPGRYPVYVTFEDEGEYLHLELASPAHSS